MATDPYAAIRNLAFTPTYTLRANLGGGNRINETFNSREEAEARRAELGANGATINEVFNPDESVLASGGFNTKYGSSAMLQDGKLYVNLQQPGAHKYDTMDAIYEKDPATGQWVLKNDPMQYQTRQQSSASNFGQALGTGAALFGGAAFAPALSGALGGGALGGAGAGAIIGGGGALASGANSDEALRAALAGGIAGGIGGYMSEPASAAGGASSGTPSAAQSGIGATTQANQLTPAALESLIGTPGYGVNAAANSYLQSIGMAPTAGWNAYGIGNTQGAQLADTEAMLNSGNWDSPFTTPQTPTFQPGDTPAGAQTVEVTGQAPAPSTPNIGMPMPPIMPEQLSPGISTPDPNQPMPEANPGQQPSLGSKFTDFLKNNPRLALTMLGMIGGAGGGNNTPSPGGAGGSQSNLTATQAPKFQRQYVAPPEGYRPGFDPEHKYFTGIGSTGG